MTFLQDHFESVSPGKTTKYTCKTVSSKERISKLQTLNKRGGKGSDFS